MDRSIPFRGVAASVLAFGVAFGYVEAAVVVYLRTALGIPAAAVLPVVPLDELAAGAETLMRIEVGREVATLVMLAAVGWAAGRTWLERLAWTSVAFGAWDLAYYLGLWVFIGWPPSIDTWDVLFLVPLPWVGPVWAPSAVSLALIGFGLAAARRERAGRPIPLHGWHVAAGVAGGVVVIGSFVLDAGLVMDGGVPASFAWPVFAAGMALAVFAAVDALRRPGQARPLPDSLAARSSR